VIDTPARRAADVRLALLRAVGRRSQRCSRRTDVREDEFGVRGAARSSSRPGGSSTRPRWHGMSGRPVSRRVRGPLPGAAGDEEVSTTWMARRRSSTGPSRRVRSPGSWRGALVSEPTWTTTPSGSSRPADAAAGPRPRAPAVVQVVLDDERARFPGDAQDLRRRSGARTAPSGFWNSGCRRRRGAVARNASASSAVSRRPRHRHGPGAGPPPWQSPTCLDRWGFDEDGAPGGASARTPW